VRKLGQLLAGNIEGHTETILKTQFSTKEKN
jgi:hypothetical protein